MIVVPLKLGEKGPILTLIAASYSVSEILFVISAPGKQETTSSISVMKDQTLSRLAST